MKPAQRIGAIYPNDVWVDEDQQLVLEDFRYFLPEGVDMVSAGTPIPALEANTEFTVRHAESGDIELAAQRLMRYSPDCFAYYCTTMSFVRGFGFDEEINGRVTKATGLPATTTSTAMIEALKSLNVKHLALASPYMHEVHEALIDFLAAHGVRVVGSVALNLSEDQSLVSPERSMRMAEEADRPEAEAVFVSCTGQRLGPLLDDMEARLGKPVLTANQVTGWHALQLLGRAPALEGRGSLFAGNTTAVL